MADWVFGILPAFIVRDLVMSRRQKVIVAAILAFAAVVSKARQTGHAKKLIRYCRFF